MNSEEDRLVNPRTETDNNLVNYPCYRPDTIFTFRHPARFSLESVRGAFERIAIASEGKAEANGLPSQQQFSDAARKSLRVSPEDAFCQQCPAERTPLSIILVGLKYEHQNPDLNPMRRQIVHNARTCLVHLLYIMNYHAVLPCFGYTDGTMYLFTAQWEQVICSTFFVESFFDISYRAWNTQLPWWNLPQ